MATSGTLAQNMIVDGGNGRADGDGVYGKQAGPNNGAVYTVAGSSGKTSGGSLDHPVMIEALNELGSAVLDFSGQQAGRPVPRRRGRRSGLLQHRQDRPVGSRRSTRAADESRGQLRSPLLHVSNFLSLYRGRPSASFEPRHHAVAPDVIFRE